MFLVPLVRDSDRKPHPPILWRQLQDAMLAEFGGLTGPDEVVLYRGPDVRGSWRPGGSMEAVEDVSRRYTVAVPVARIGRLKALLCRVGNSFDQKAMYVEVSGFAEELVVRPEDGFLDDR